VILSGRCIIYRCYVFRDEPGSIGTWDAKQFRTKIITSKYILGWGDMIKHYDYINSSLALLHIMSTYITLLKPIS